MTRKPINFTVANRKRLLTLEAIEMISEIILKYGHTVGMQKKSADCCKRINNRMENIRALLWNQREAADILLYPKEYQKYTRMREDMYRFLIEHDSSSGADHIDHKELSNTALVLVAKELDNIKGTIQKSDSPKLKWLNHEWTMLLNSLVTLYTHMDPEFQEEGRMRMGEALAAKILLIAEGKPFLKKQLASA